MLASPLYPALPFTSQLPSDDHSQLRPAKDIDAFNSLLPPPIEFVEGSSSGTLAVAEGKYEPINDTPKPGKKQHEHVKTPNTPTPASSRTLPPSSPSVKVHSLYNGILDFTWPPGHSVGAGLHNTGNTCFLNSALQCLLHTPPLLRVLTAHSKSDPCRVKNGFCMSCNLRQVMTDSHSKSHPFTPYQITTKLQLIAKHMRKGRQEDSHEFLRYAIDALQKSCITGYSQKLDHKMAETTWVHKIFGGRLRSRVTCRECHHNSDTFDSMLDISLDIYGCSSLKEALRKFVAVDYLKGSDKYKCEKCKKPVVAEKRFTIHDAPAVLTVHLKRFSPLGRKIGHFIHYDERVSLQPVMSAATSLPFSPRLRASQQFGALAPYQYLIFLIVTTAMNSYNQQHHLPVRRAHRKRYSVSRLSSETVQTLPEYSSPPAWSRSAKQAVLEGVEHDESDRPPDYPETADEGDADTEEQAIVYIPQHLVSPTRHSPSRIRRRRRAPVPAADPVLDMLLERSVHALEMSNALLQSSMSTKSSLSALLSSESGPDRSLEVRARNLSTRIRVNSGVHKTWMDNLEEISRGVDRLLDEEQPVTLPEESGMSRSLPTSTVPELRHRRRPSLLELTGSSSSSSQLQYSHPARDVLISPAPRALTQYVESTADPEVIILPSTLGIRDSASSHSTDSHDHTFPNQKEMQSVQSPSFIPDCQPDNSTPAYHYLSNLAKRSGSLTPPSSSRPSSSRPRRGSSSTTSTERGTKTSLSPSSIRTIRASPDRSRLGKEPSAFRSRSATPKPRRMTPPIEELSLSSSESTSSSDHPTGYRTVQSLRKILDEHPSSLSVNTFPRKTRKYPRVPTFLPASPPPAALTGTSTATASITRLFTKNRHSMSTRPPSPPTQSSLKVRSVPSTPAPSPSTQSLSDLPDNAVARKFISGPASGISTPKRISFAELPESYATSRQGGAGLKERKGKRKTKKGKDHNSEDEEAGGWWQTLFTVGLSTGVSDARRREERTEERMTRGWGSRPGYGTLDDWAV